MRKLPLSFFGKRDLSDLTTTIMADCTTLEQSFSHWIPEFFGSMISTVIIAVCLFIFDWRMALAALWVLPVSLAIVAFSGKVQNYFTRRQTEAKLAVADGIQEALETMRDLKSNNAEEKYLKGLDKKIDLQEKRMIASELGGALFVVPAGMILKLGIGTVALDLTVNSGGSLAAMVGALGFLTDAPIPYSCGDLITGRNTVEYYLVDTDGDGDYTDADAYDMYDWYVLTSPLTFSAANFFASIVQDTGIATVIGERSGGGTCSVFTLVLPDGTTANISGSRTVLQSPVYEGGVVVGAELVESGIAPDIALERQYFYNDASLVDAIQKGADQ